MPLPYDVFVCVQSFLKCGEEHPYMVSVDKSVINIHGNVKYSPVTFVAVFWCLCS